MKGLRSFREGRLGFSGEEKGLGLQPSGERGIFDGGRYCCGFRLRWCRRLWGKGAARGGGDRVSGCRRWCSGGLKVVLGFTYLTIA